jgi:glucokinase
MNFIGIDIGGTSIKGLVVNRYGDVLNEYQVNTEANKGNGRIAHHLETVIRRLFDSSLEIAGIGIGTAGRVNTDSGCVLYATDNLPGWQGIDLRKTYEEKFGLPIVVDNDANTALVGEAWIGAGAGLSDLTMLTLGTGVGGANMIGSRLYRGVHWHGGEWGHVVFIPHGRPCNCGREGCAEQYLSGTALVRLAQEATQRVYVSGREVFDDYQRGDKAIAAVIQEFVEHLAIFIQNIHMGLDPSAILVGGGVVEAKALWWSSLQHRLAELVPSLDVRPASLGNKAGAMGAAKLVMDALLLKR